MSVLKEIKGGKIPMFCDTVSSWMSENFKQSQAFWIKVWCDSLPRLIASLTKGCCFSHPGLEAHAHDWGSFRFADYAHADASLKIVWAKDSLLCKGCVIREIGTALQWRPLMHSSSDSAFQTHLSTKIQYTAGCCETVSGETPLHRVLPLVKAEACRVTSN